MASSSTTAVSNNTDRLRDSSIRRNNKKIQKQSHGDGDGDRTPQNFINNIEITPWKSEAQHKVYCSKLLQALRQVRLGSDTSPPRGRAVREAADRVLALTARGRSRWSRAILSNKLKRKFLKSHRRRRGVTPTATRRLRRPRASVLRSKTTVLRKARVLGRLVPGCRKLPMPVVLEEATDYIAALEMQVKSMAALADILSAGSGSGSGHGAAAVSLSQLDLTRPPPCT